MPVEIEAKMKIDEVEGVLARLRACSATFVGSYLETNAFYDTDDRALLAMDEGLRLRVRHELTTGKVDCMLTHKGADRIGRLKSREETELGISSPEDAALLLQRLGYVRCLSFEKRRQSWKLDGCRIEVDEMPYLGCFVEIEGASEESILKVREKLGMADRPLIKASYAAMLNSYLQERGDTATEVCFPRPQTSVARAG